MCLAIFQPAAVTVPETALRAGWCSNSDGAGFAYLRKGKVKVQKGYMSLKDFMEAYSDAAGKNKDSPFLIHFRIRSQGDKSSANTHPFELPTGAVIHNGTLDGTGATWGVGESDTAKFVSKFKDILNFDFLSAKKKEMEDAVSYNKMAFLFNDGRHVILNESKGHWDGGVWYSNGSYKSAWSTGKNGRSCDMQDYTGAYGMYPGIDY